jgi:hypothetical protein
MIIENEGKFLKAFEGERKPKDTNNTNERTRGSKDFVSTDRKN